MSIKTLAADSEVLKKNLLYSSLTKFYNSIAKEDIELFLDIISGKSKISLRIIDWFVTNYSKKKNIVYYINNDGESKLGSKGKNGSLKKKMLQIQTLRLAFQNFKDLMPYLKLHQKLLMSWVCTLLQKKQRLQLKWRLIS